MPSYRLNDDGSFVITDYQRARPFASFLPGIAGLMGRPGWAFWVSRGQCISAFGQRDKDGAMLEFQPANKAYHLVHSHGFRTFVRTGGRCFEPFAMRRDGSAQILTVRRHEVACADHDAASGLAFTVAHFHLPEDEAAVLVRRLEISNPGSAPLDVELLDGLPQIVPACVKDASIKGMANTKCGTVETLGLDRSLLWCRSRVKSSDAVVIEMVGAGNAYAADLDGAALPIIGDPELVFSPGGSFAAPLAFAEGFAVPTQQRHLNLLPCAFAHARCTIPAGERVVLHAWAGQIEGLDRAFALAGRLRAPGLLAARRARAAEIIARTADAAAVATGSPAFDQAVRQAFLDNCLRGGFPMAVGSTAVHVYFRKHGDLERDYNAFTVDPAPWSQGNGNFRDVLQNRRLDALVEPAAALPTLRAFIDAIQPDGNNPLVYEGTRLRLADGGEALAQRFGAVADGLRRLLAGEPSPGAIAAWAEANREALGLGPDELLATVLASAERCDSFRAEKGYWSDHWTYLLDLIESFAAVWPDRLDELLARPDGFTWYENAERILPLAERFVLIDGRLRCPDGTAVDAAVAARIAARRRDPHRCRIAGSERLATAGLAEKLLCLLATRIAALDPCQRGIEMQGNRPGWNDAMNGLPALLGSSSCETAEALRLARFLARNLPGQVDVSSEVAALVAGVVTALAETAPGLERWRALHAAAAAHDAATRPGLSGARVRLAPRDFLDRADALLTAAVADCRQGDGLYTTYVRHEATAWEELRGADGEPLRRGGHPRVMPTAIAPHPLPAFLEGQVRAMKVLDEVGRRDLHRAVRASPLYDRALCMYRLNASLAAEPTAIGRAGIFPDGWLENASIWLHMHYKWLLEVQRAGLDDAFAEDSRRGLTCFLDPAVYGRSPCEASSFICSSAHPDPSFHGVGFYARLSGATIELLSMTAHAFGLDRAFRATPDGLAFRPEPRPLAWMWGPARRFAWQGPDGPHAIDLPEASAATLLFGRTAVVLHRGSGAGQVRAFAIDGVPAPGPALAADQAHALRDGRVARLDILLA